MAYTGPISFPVSIGGTGHTTNPSFFAYRSSSVANVTGDGTPYVVLFNSVAYDTTSSYNTVTGLYTAPVTGNYFLMASIAFQGIINTITIANLYFSTSAPSTYTVISNDPFAAAPAGALTFSGSSIVSLTATQTVSVTFQCSNGTKVIDVNGSPSPNFSTFFAGYLLI